MKDSGIAINIWLTSELFDVERAIMIAEGIIHDDSEKVLEKTNT